MSTTPPRGGDKDGRKAFALRLSAPVFDGLQRWADDELRSLNAQIEYLLRDALRRAGRLPEPPEPAAAALNDRQTS